MSSDHHFPSNGKAKRRSLILGLVFAAVVVAVGWRYYKYRCAEMVGTAQNQLASIADLKVGLISRWLKERRGDIEIARYNPLLLRILADPANPAIRQEFAAWMGILQTTSEYSLIALFDARGNLQIAEPADAPARYPCLDEHVRAALASGSITIVDLHRPRPDVPIHMSLLVPLSQNPDFDGPTAGVLMVIINPARFLYPLVESWPFPSRTAETLLVRRDGNEVLFLNDLRHKPGSALTLRLPLDSRSKLPAAIGLQGFEGILEGSDYRGVPVLAAVRRIPEMGWVMISKIDQDEVLAPVRREAAFLGLIIFLLFAMGLLGKVLIQRRMHTMTLRRDLEASRRAEETAKANETIKQSQLEAAERSRQALLSMIEDREEAEEALRMSEAQLSNALAMARAGHWEYDVDSDTFTFNDNFFRVFRTTAEDVGGYTMSSAEYARRFCHPEDAPLVAGEIRAALVTDDPNFSRYLEHRILFSDGEIGHIAVRFSIIKDARRRTVKTYGVNQDITERVREEERKKDLEVRMQQQQRLESIGTLASGVAHEINNPMNGIQNYAQLIADGLEAGHPLQEYASEIMKESDRVSGIVRALLAFSRHEKQSHSPADFRDIVTATLALTRSLIHHDQIRLEVEIAEDLPKVKCRSQQIQQVLMNLLTNARDALNETYPGYHEDKFLRLKVLRFEREGRAWIRLAVENNGIPVPAEVREHLFEPFFTTKSRDKGTGLGLSISYGIAKDHHGELYLASGPGEPTRFHLDLPLNDSWSLEESGGAAAGRQPGKE